MLKIPINKNVKPRLENFSIKETKLSPTIVHSKPIDQLNLILDGRTKSKVIIIAVANAQTLIINVYSR